MSAVTDRFGLVDADGDSLGAITVHDARRLTVVALKSFADAKRRQAASRPNAGAALVEYRASLRSAAAELERLAELLEREWVRISEAAPVAAGDPVCRMSISLTVDALFHHAEVSRRNSQSRKLAGAAYKQHRQAWRDRSVLCGALAVALRDGTLRLVGEGVREDPAGSLETKGLARVEGGQVSLTARGRDLAAGTQP